jgi:hypothetical protein
MENSTQFTNTQAISFLEPKLSVHSTTIQLYFTTFRNTQIVAVLPLFDDRYLRLSEQTPNSQVTVTATTDGGGGFIESDNPGIAFVG